MLDRGRGAVGLAAALDHVGVERALGQEPGAGDRPGLVAEDVDERVADPDAASPGGRSRPRGRSRNRRPRRRPAARRSVRAPNASATASRSPRAKQPVVDEDADDPRARVPWPAAPRRPPNRRRRRGRRRPGRPGRPGARSRPSDRSMNAPIVQVRGLLADPVEEVAQDQRAVGRVRDLGVELEAVDRPLAVPDGGDRAGRRSPPGG